MSKEIVTIRDRDGICWTGTLVGPGRLDNRGLLWGFLTDGWSLLFQSRKIFTVEVDGKWHSGHEEKRKP